MTRVVLTEEFIERLKRLRKKYPHVSDDLQPLIDLLKEGQTPGDRLQGQSGIAYKVRLANRDTRRGKSGGYRVIYYVRTEELFFLLNIYTKTEIVDIPDATIATLISKYSTFDISSDE